MTQKLTALILTLGMYFTALADTFTVTSNASSGPGTLREAIVAANSNGTATKDFIVFNLSDPSEAGRTITLLDSLPALTSNLVIDGTSQPGPALGVSDARVKIISSGAGVPRCFVLFNVEDIEIYGLYFSNFTTGGIHFNQCAIYITGWVKRLTIGKAGKGNVFYRNAAGIQQGRDWNTSPVDLRASDVLIQANFFGLDADGNTVHNIYGYALRFGATRNLTIGGWDKEEGNYFVGDTEGVVTVYSDSSSNNGNLYFINNKCGVNYAQTVPLKFGGAQFWNNANSRGDDSVFVLNNLINDPSYVGTNWGKVMISVAYKKGYITVKGNRIGMLINNLFSSQTTGIAIGNCENGIIGGETPEEQNLIAYNYTNGISVYECRNITISKNSIYCNSQGIRSTSSKVAIPRVHIMEENGTNRVAGTAPPHTKIEVFETPECAGCKNGRNYLGTTTADNTGNWSLTANYSSAVTATATTPEGATGEFAHPEYDITQLTSRPPTCGQKNGYIKGIKFVSGTRFYWLVYRNGTRDTLFNQLDLENIGPGFYEFTVEQTKYCTVMHRVVLSDNSPKINAANARTLQPSCGKANGAIENIYASGSYNKILWKDTQGRTVGSTLSLTNAAPGQYKLLVLDTVYHCGDSTQLFTLTNQSGPNLNTTSVQVNPATCGRANGSITGLSTSNVTGVPFIQWQDASGKPAGNSLELRDVPAGLYRMKFKDGGGCDTIVTPFYTIEATRAIRIDTSALQVTTSQCAYKSGTIKGITVTGATDFEWIDSTGTVVSTSLDPGYVYSGTYVLVARNATCEARTQSIFVPTYPTMGFTVRPDIRGSAGRCDSLNGFVRFNNFPNPQNYTFRWVDTTNTSVVLSTTLELTGFNGGVFFLYAKDARGCEQKALTAVLPAVPAPQLDERQAVVTDDLCAQGTGGVKGLLPVSGKGKAPLRYSWLNEDNTPIATTQDLGPVGAGQYRLVLHDAAGCRDSSSVFKVGNKAQSLPAPRYSDQHIRSGSTATLSAQNAQPGLYLLCTAPDTSAVLQRSTTGAFTTPALTADQKYYVQEVKGSCTSDWTAVNVLVYNKTEVYVPTAFTPNGDGRNDLLKVMAYGPVSLEYFTVFNRWGEVVFTTNKLAEGWDGRIKGKTQNAGIYAWIIKARDELTGQAIELKGTTVIIR